jgi:uncharacterized protein
MGGNVQTVKDMYSAFGRGDVPAVLGSLDPKIEWREAEGNPYQPSGDAWIGPDAVVENLFMKLGTDWEGFSVTPAEIHDAGNTVIVQGRYRGTYKATGRSMDAQFCHIMTFRDGKVTAFQQYVDTGQWQSVAGDR